MKRYMLFAACCAALLAVPMAVNSQQPGGDNGGGRGGRGGRGGFGGGPGGFGGGGSPMGGDPSAFFDMISKGKDVIRRDELDPMFQRMFDRMAEAQGITNGQITRDQFKTASEAMRNRIRGGSGGPTGGPGSGAPGGKGEMTPEQMDRLAEDSFRKLDKDSDGQLQFTEMSENLKPVWTTYDTNKDGNINLEEYKAFYRDRIQIRMQERAQAQEANGQPPSADGLPPESDAAPAQDDDKRPTVYRFGKLPKDLPPWFTELDTYKDGQIWLSSWVKAGRSVEEFKAMDRNDDGLLTVEEYLGYVRGNTTKSPGETVLASAAGEERGGRPGFGGPGGPTGGFGGRNRGPGGSNGDPAAAGGTQGGFGRRDRGNGSGGPGGGMQGGFGNRGSRGGTDAPSGAGQSPGQNQGESDRRKGRGGRGPGSGKDADRGTIPANTGNSKDAREPMIEKPLAALRDNR